MRKLIAVLFAMFLMVGNVSALSDAQIEAINNMLNGWVETIVVGEDVTYIRHEGLNQMVNRITSARNYVNTLLRLDPYINDDALIMRLINAAKARASVAASDLNDLLQ